MSKINFFPSIYHKVHKKTKIVGRGGVVVSSCNLQRVPYAYKQQIFMNTIAILQNRKQ